LQIIATEGRATTLAAAQISNLPHIVVKVLDHDAPAARFEGVSLASLLSTTGVQLSDKLRGARMTQVLLVEAADAKEVSAEGNPHIRNYIGEIRDAWEAKVTLRDLRTGLALQLAAGKSTVWKNQNPDPL
jgi:hypothetical protein